MPHRHITVRAMINGYKNDYYIDINVLLLHLNQIKINTGRCSHTRSTDAVVDAIADTHDLDYTRSISIRTNNFNFVM